MILRYFVIMFFADKGKGTVGILWMQGAPVLETFLCKMKGEKGSSKEGYNLCSSMVQHGHIEPPTFVPSPLGKATEEFAAAWQARSSGEFCAKVLKLVNCVRARGCEFSGSFGEGSGCGNNVLGKLRMWFWDVLRRSGSGGGSRKFSGR